MDAVVFGSSTNGVAVATRAMKETSPRRWLTIRKKVRDMNTSVLQRVLEIFEQAMMATDEFIATKKSKALIGGSDQSALIDSIKARRFVLMAIQNDLRASTAGLPAVSGAQRRPAMHANILGGTADPFIHHRRTIALQLILDLFLNDCLRGLTRCRSGITTCGEYIQSWAGRSN
ncbi:MAG: hypothetical protein Q9195_008939 [Heterodermia aff. obscurata]